MIIGEKKEHHLILQGPKTQNDYCGKGYKFHLVKIEVYQKCKCDKMYIITIHIKLNY